MNINSYPPAAGCGPAGRNESPSPVLTSGAPVGYCARRYSPYSAYASVTTSTSDGTTTSRKIPVPLAANAIAHPTSGTVNHSVPMTSFGATRYGSGSSFASPAVRNRCPSSVQTTSTTEKLTSDEMNPRATPFGFISHHRPPPSQYRITTSAELMNCPICAFHLVRQPVTMTSIRYVDRQPSRQAQTLQTECRPPSDDFSNKSETIC